MIDQLLPAVLEFGSPVAVVAIIGWLLEYRRANSTSARVIETLHELQRTLADIRASLNLIMDREERR